MPVTTPTPAPYDQADVRSRLTFHWRVEDLAADALTGQAATVTRTSGDSVTDQQGTSYTVDQDRIGWHWVTTTGGRSVATARMTSSVELRWAFAQTPRAHTGLLHFVETSESSESGLFYIGNDGRTGARLEIIRTAAQNYEIRHNNGSSEVSSVANIDTSSGDEVWLRWELDSNGAVQMHMRVNTGPEETSEQSGNASLASAWNGTRAYANALGGSLAGSMDLRFIKIKPGTGHGAPTTSTTLVNMNFSDGSTWNFSGGSRFQAQDFSEDDDNLDDFGI